MAQTAPHLSSSWLWVEPDADLVEQLRLLHLDVEGDPEDRSRDRP